MDRTYFHSIYYREPGGVLFEIATDNPGFAVDETPDKLGTKLMLPAQYEPLRAEIDQIIPKCVYPADLQSRQLLKKIATPPGIFHGRGLVRELISNVR